MRQMRISFLIPALFFFSFPATSRSQHPDVVFAIQAWCGSGPQISARISMSCRHLFFVCCWHRLASMLVKYLSPFAFHPDTYTTHKTLSYTMNLVQSCRYQSSALPRRYPADNACRTTGKCVLSPISIIAASTRLQLATPLLSCTPEMFSTLSLSLKHCKQALV